MPGRSALLLCAAALLSCTPAWKKAIGERPDRPVRFSTFRSGLRLVVFQDPTPDRFELAMVYGVGAVADPAGKEGLADLARRLSQRTRSGEMERADRLYAAGAQSWSETGLDAMSFRARGPMQALEAALAVEAERLARPVDVTDPAVLEAASAEVALDAPGAGGASSQLARLAEEILAGHPYARPLFGSPASVRSIRLEEVHRFAAEHLHPANAVLVVASGGDPELVARRVRERLSAAGAATSAATVAPAARSPAPPLPVPPSEPALRTLHAGTGARLWLGWALPGGQGPQVVSSILALGELERRLSRRLGERDLSRRVQGVSVDALAGAWAGLAYARIDLVSGDDAPAVLAAVTDLLRAQANRHNVAALSDLGAFIAEHVEAMPDPDLGTVAQLVRFGYGPDYVEALRARVDAGADRGALMQAVEQTFSPARMHRVLFLPREPEGGGAALALPSLAVPVPHAEGYRAPGAAAAAGLVRAAAPPAEYLAVPGGLSVVAVRRPGTGRVSARLVFPVALEPDRAGLGPLAVWSARPASPSCPAVGGSFHRDHVSFAAWGRGKQLDELVGALRCSAADPRVDPGTFTSNRDGIARSLRRETPGAMERADVQVCQAALPPGVCRGRLLPAQVERLAPADGDRWLAANLRPDRAVLVLVGDLPATPDLTAVLADELGTWRAQPAPAAVPPVAAVTRRALVVPVPGARDAWLQVVYRSPDGKDLAADQALAARLETLLAPARGALSWDQVSVQAIERRGASALLVRAGLSRGSVGPLLERLEEALGRLAAAEPAGEALDQARWQVARAFFFARWTDEQLASGLMEDQAALGTAVPDPGTAIATLEPSRFRAAARRFAAAQPTAVLVGDPAFLEAQLRGAGYPMELVPDEPSPAPAAAPAR